MSHGRSLVRLPDWLAESSKNDVIDFVCEDGKFNLQEKEVSSTLPLHGHKVRQTSEPP